MEGRDRDRGTAAVVGGTGRLACAKLGAMRLLGAKLAKALAGFILLGTGCAKPWTYQANINSDDVNERILAIRKAGEEKDRAAVPLLVDRLEDEDSAVRFYAILSLERITGQRFGFDYARSDAARVKSVELWREYLKSPDRALSMERDGQRGSVSNASSPSGL